jgi:hypothetical protein
MAIRSIKNIRLQFARWDDLTAEDQAQFTEFMGGDPQRGKSLYELYFYWYNIPHEVAHILRTIYNQQTNQIWDQIWEEETAVNQIAVSYWRAKGQQMRLLHLESEIIYALQHIPDPVPANEDRAIFLNRHHHDLADTSSYAHYQFNMVRYALAHPMDLSYALRKLVSPQASDGATIPISPDFPLDEDLPYRTVDDMRKTLAACGLRLPDIQIICMYSPALQFVLWDS